MSNSSSASTTGWLIAMIVLLSLAVPIIIIAIATAH